MAGERLIEALTISLEDLHLTREHQRALASRGPNAPSLAAPPRNPVFIALGNISPESHVLTTLQKILPSHLQDALLVLPFDKVIALLTFLNIFAEKENNIPLTCRVLFFVLRVHHKQIVATKAMRGMLDSVRENLRKALRRQKDLVGFNLAGVKFVQRELRERRVVGLGDDFEAIAKEAAAGGTSGKKRGFASVA
jgi:U3 small nucleolar RNA-associated protein 12